MLLRIYEILSLILISCSTVSQSLEMELPITEAIFMMKYLESQHEINKILRLSEDRQVVYFDSVWTVYGNGLKAEYYTRIRDSIVLFGSWNNDRAMVYVTFGQPSVRNFKLYTYQHGSALYYEEHDYRKKNKSRFEIWYYDSELRYPLIFKDDIGLGNNYRLTNYENFTYLKMILK